MSYLDAIIGMSARNKRSGTNGIVVGLHPRNAGYDIAIIVKVVLPNGKHQHRFWSAHNIELFSEEGAQIIPTGRFLTAAGDVV